MVVGCEKDVNRHYALSTPTARTVRLPDHRLLHSTQIPVPGREYGTRSLQELQSLDTTARILLPDHSNRNTLRSDGWDCSALLRRKSMGLPTHLPTHRTNPHNQSRCQH